LPDDKVEVAPGITISNEDVKADPKKTSSITEFYSGEVPKKLGKVGKEAVAFIKKKGGKQKLSDIYKGTQHPQGKLKPQLALACARGLLTYADGEFNAVG
jgi:hypothetical protein